jgi:hypothetical protein
MQQTWNQRWLNLQVYQQLHDQAEARGDEAEAARWLQAFDQHVEHIHEWLDQGAPDWAKACLGTKRSK